MMRVQSCSKFLTKTIFGKGIERNDLLYFAKVEHERTTGPQDLVVLVGEIKRGQIKEGEQTHIHVLVSRKENLVRYTDRRPLISLR
jgi:predicted DNA-binding protein with PD1-like motif